MTTSHADVISSQKLATGDHYYSGGDHLRAKHRLAGDAFVKWGLDLIPDWNAATILDAGGGWGRYVWELIDNYQVDAQDVVLTDLSAGMLDTAFEEGARRDVTLKAAVVSSIEALPFASRQFDIVMANKVLYHLSDIPRGVKELARVVQPNGYLLATTNSDKITSTIIDLHYRALATVGIPFRPEAPSTFSMENGGHLLATGFRHVEQHYYEAETLIYDAAQIRATYETIGRYRNLLPRDDISEAAKEALPHVVEELAQSIIERDGVLRSPDLMGAFVCSDPII